MAEASFLQTLLDPTAAPPPAHWLWPCLLGGAAVSVLGALLIVRLTRGLGPPTGALPGPAGIVGVGLSLALVFLPEALARYDAPLLTGAVTCLAAIVAMALLAGVQSSGGAASDPQWMRADRRALLRGVVVWLVLLPALVACVLASVAGVRLAGGEVTPQPQLDAATGGTGLAWVAGWYMLAALAAPLREEFIFRLVLYGALAGWLARGESWRDPGRLAAAAISIGLFVAAHGDWVIGFVPLALLAWTLTMLLAHSRSLWPCVLVHALHNALVLTVQFFVLH